MLLERISIAVLVFVCLAFVPGCALVDSKMKAWVGKHESELIASWGAPTYVHEDGRGGTLLVYEHVETYTTPGHSTTTGYSSGVTQGYGNVQTQTYGNQVQAYGTVNSNNYGSSHSTTTYTPPETNEYKTTRSFFVDSEGRIYRYAWKGL